MSACTIFKNYTKPIEVLSLVLIAKRISSGKYIEEILEIRNLLEQGKTEEAADKKKQLLAFTPSGIFTEQRLMKHLERYTGFLHLDFDKLTTEQMQNALEVITKIPYTFICFISPSGNGVKVFMEVDSSMEHHATAYLQIQKYYEEATGLKSDPACKDITRLCFMSYDPNLYMNLNYQKFQVLIPQTEMVKIQEQHPVAINNHKQVRHAESENLNTIFIFQQQIQFTNTKSIYQNGNRNNYMYLLGSNCNRAGLSESDTIQHCIQNFDLPETEIQKSVRSAYTHHLGEFAKFAKIANIQTLQNEEESDIDYLKNTPTIPDSVFANLPDILNRGCSVFPDKRKRDVFFTGAIAILSGCLPNVTGIYDNERVYPHLYTFIIAPAASGKGVLKNAKRLADKYHQQIVEESREQQRRYKIELSDYNNQKYQKKNEEQPPEKPEEPAFKVVFIPANCSQARIIEHLEHNEGQGIICETEADTMSSTKKQDWGDYSTIMRQAFHHEKISLSRKTNNEFIEIIEPRLAITLTGTPAQAPKLIASAEDGLFSRFLFYAYKNEIEWADPSPKEKTVVFNDHFDALATELLEGIGFLSYSETKVYLSAEQWKELNTTFRAILADVTIFTSEDAVSLVYRLGLITFRLCMIFSALRKIENAECTTEMYCMQQDFDSIMLIVKTYLQHNILMFNNLPKQNDKILFQANDQKRNLFDALPQEFTRKQAVELSKSYKISTRSVDDILRAAVGKTLTKIKSGLYQKI